MADSAMVDQLYQRRAHTPMLGGLLGNRLVRAWIRDLLISLFLAAIVILFLYQPIRVEGTSMMPALLDEQRLFINKFVYRYGLGDVERGDLVVFWFPGDRRRSYIKRVIGLPGDAVEINEGKVRINGLPLEEPYVPAAYRDRTSQKSLTVPLDHYFVMGDHRSSSDDSRSWGPLHRNYIYGQAAFVYWPLDRMGRVR